MSFADTSHTGDAVMHDAPTVALDYGPVVGFGLTLFAFAANQGISLEDADKLAQFVTHACFAVVAMVGAGKMIVPAITKTWNWLRRRFA